MSKQIVILLGPPGCGKGTVSPLVVDTFGICSFDKPAEAISEMARVLKTNGRLVLLEHGRTSNGLVQMFLDRSRIMNLHKYGCDANKDMLGLVRAEPKLGRMEVCERKQFGHIYLMVARKLPKEEVVEAEKPVEVESDSGGESGGKPCGCSHD